MKLAEYYAFTHSELSKEMRIDAVAVIIGDGGAPVIEHMENITGF